MGVGIDGTLEEEALREAGGLEVDDEDDGADAEAETATEFESISGSYSVKTA